MEKQLPDFLNRGEICIFMYGLRQANTPNFKAPVTAF